MDIFDILTNLIFWILPLYIVVVILKMIFVDIQKIHETKNNWYAIKILFGIALIFPIILSIMFITVTSVFVVANVIEQSEIKHNTTIPYWIKQIIYISIIFIWSLIGVVIHNYIYSKLSSTQLIPGLGSIKQRLNTHVYTFKKIINKKEES